MSYKGDYMRKTKVVNIRITEEELKLIEQKTKESNFRSISEFIRYIALNYKKEKLNATKIN